jgi:hypothetical protein
LYLLNESLFFVLNEKKIFKKNLTSPLNDTLLFFIIFSFSSFNFVEIN